MYAARVLCLHVRREGERSRRRRLPAAVRALYPSRVLPLHGDGAHDLDAVRINDADHLDHFQSGSSDTGFKLNFGDLRAAGLLIEPFAERARAVTAEIDAAQWHRACGRGRQ